MKEQIKKYLSRVYSARYFWIHLARIELKNKFRRSKLGILWVFISPLCLTAIMSVVFATAFHMEIVTYAPYVLTGLLSWEVFTGSFVGSSYTIVSNDAYIRQFNHPVTIYTLKSAIVISLSFCISLIAIALWELFVAPLHVLVGIATLPFTLVIYFFFAWGAATIAALTCTKYRDYPQMAPLILQAIWYVSPVFFQENMFSGNKYLSLMFNINPIPHMLRLLRAPFLEGRFPSLIDYAFSLGLTILVGLYAIHRARKDSRDIIFYI